MQLKYALSETSTIAMRFFPSPTNPAARRANEPLRMAVKPRFVAFCTRALARMPRGVPKTIPGKTMYESMNPGGIICYYNSKKKKNEQLARTLRISVDNCEVDVAVRLCCGEGLDLCYIRVPVYRLRGEHALGVVRETS